MHIRPIVFKPTGVGGAHARKPRRPHWRNRRTTTAVIAFANFTTRPNVALGIESDGFAAACGLKPLAQPTAVGSTM